MPKCTLEVLKIASKLKKRVVIGTTGFTKKQEQMIKNFSKKIPILKAGNMSLGVNLLMYLTEIASKSLGKKFLSNCSFISRFSINNRKIKFSKVLKSYFEFLFEIYKLLNSAGLDNFERNN